jgi:hypothetical protein
LSLAAAKKEILVEMDAGCNGRNGPSKGDLHATRNSFHKPGLVCFLFVSIGGGSAGMVRGGIDAATIRRRHGRIGDLVGQTERRVAIGHRQSYRIRDADAEFPAGRLLGQARTLFRFCEIRPNRRMGRSLDAHRRRLAHGGVR